MKKKIIFISEALWIGGIETALVNLLNRMDYEKYDVTCLVIRGSLELAERITPRCRLIVSDREKAFTFPEAYKYSRLYHLTEESKNPSRLHRAMMWAVPAIKWVENRLYIRYIREQMKDESFDTCVIYSDRTAETAVRGIRTGKYLMFYHHGAMRREYHDEIGYRKSEKIIAVSNAVEQQLREFRPKHAHKMMTIHNLTDVEGVRAKGEEPVPEEFPADKFNIVSCGRVSYEKGMDLAVEACARLVEMGHDNIHWWIVGGGPAEDEVRAKIADLNIEDYVTMLGMKENPYPYIKRADLYVQPSRIEGYPMTILEALLLGQPVVSTGNTGAREILESEKIGLLCDISSDAIVETLITLLNQQGGVDTMRGYVARLDRHERNRQIVVMLEKQL